MTDQLHPVAVQNASLLQAIGQGPYPSLSALAAAADLVVNNLNRKLDVLLELRQIEQTGTASHDVALTDAGRRTLASLEFFATGAAPGGVIMVDPDLIDPNPHQPRITEDPEADAEMVVSVADKGIQTPIKARLEPSGRYTQAFGHRRVRGARAAGKLVPVIPADLTDDDLLEMAGIENLQRDDLHWMDAADYFRKLAERGRSAEQIRRMCGEGGRSKRKVQELIQFARELEPEDKRRARLPRTDPDHLSVEACRAKVGNKRPRLAIDLPPKLACAFLELLHSAGCIGGEVGDDIRSDLKRWPKGGALITLSDRQLIRFAFDNGGVVAVIAITEDVAQYLREVGYDDDPGEAVAKAREAAFGSLAAGIAARDGAWLTPELNPPERQAEEVPAQLGERPDQSPAGMQLPSDTPTGDEPGETRQAAPPMPPVLGPDQALIVVELAHRICWHAATATLLPATKVDPCYRDDPEATRLVHARMVMFIVGPDGALAGLTPAAFAWLATLGIGPTHDGRPSVGGEQLAAFQLELAGMNWRGEGMDGAVYRTPWLNPDGVAALLTSPAPAPRFAHTVREGEIRRDSFSQQVLAAINMPDVEIAAPALDPAALTRLMAAAREVRALVESAQTRVLKAKETRPALALLDAALGDAERALDRLTPQPLGEA